MSAAEPARDVPSPARAADTNGASRGALLALAATVGICGVAIAHAWSYLPFVSDDALIALRYSERLVAGLGLTWTAGERVEGYSDLLWVLLVALAHALGADSLSAARALGLLGLVLAVVAASLDPATLRPDLRRALSGGLLVVSTGGVAAWAVGGLEHTLLAGTTALALVLLGRAETARSGSAVVAALLFGAAALLRADGGLLGVAAAVGTLVARGPRRGAALAALVVGVVVATVAAQTAWRYGYYGELVPNTALIKVSFTWERSRVGIGYVRAGCRGHAILLLAAAAAAVLAPSRRTAAPLAVAAAWFAYIAYVGGDSIYSAWRQLVPVLPALALAVSEGAAAVRWTAARSFAWAGVLASYALAQQANREVREARRERWEWEGHGPALMLRDAFADRKPLVAVDAAGAVPYWSGLPALDMLGLNDRWIATHPRRRSGGGWVGHDFGDPDYVLRRAPDLVIFGSAVGTPEPVFPGGVELGRRPEFRRLYERVTVRSDLPPFARGYWYVRREGKLGVQRSADGVEVPAWLLGADGAQLHREPDGGLALQVSPEHRGHLDRLPVRPGRWTIRAEPPEVRVTAVCGAMRATGQGEVVLAVASQQQIELILEADAQTGVRAVRLERTPGAPADATCGSAARR